VRSIEFQLYLVVSGRQSIRYCYPGTLLVTFVPQKLVHKQARDGIQLGQRRKESNLDPDQRSERHNLR